MSWSFAKLMDHWGRKHALAAYIPSENRDVTTAEGTIREYRFGQTVYLGTGTDFTFFLDALRDGTVRYDPGMHAPATAGDNTIKVRSLFRISSADLSRLYREFASVDACTPSLEPAQRGGVPGAQGALPDSRHAPAPIEQGLAVPLITLAIP
jgi:hypothetical protein